MEVGVRDNTGKFTESFEVFAKLPSGTLTSVIVQFETKVRDLKSIIEFRCGIPSQLQQLSYKNHYELSDKDTLRALCVIPGVQVPVNFLHGYEDLIEAALSGNTKGVLDDLKKRYDNTNIRQRKIAALFVAAQRGYHFLVERLVKDGTEVNEQTPTGRTPLHIACAMGNNGCIDLLLEAGACLDIQDYYGQTPIEVAFNCKQKEAERRLHLFRRTIKGPTIYRRKVDQPRERAMSSWAWTPRFRSRSVPPAALMREISLTPGPELMISQCKIEESTSANKSVNFDESTIVSEDSSDISSRPGSEESGESSKENIESTPRSVKSGGISHQEWLVKKQIEGRTKSRDGTCSHSDLRKNEAYDNWLTGKGKSKSHHPQDKGTSDPAKETATTGKLYEDWQNEKEDYNRIATIVNPPLPNSVTVGAITIYKINPEDNQRAVKEWIRNKKKQEKQTAIYEQWQHKQMKDLERERAILKSSCSARSADEWQNELKRRDEEARLREAQRKKTEEMRQRELAERRSNSAQGFEAWLDMKQAQQWGKDGDKQQRKEIKRQKQAMAQKSFEKWLMGKEWDELCRLKEKPTNAPRPKTTGSSARLSSRKTR